MPHGNSSRFPHTSRVLTTMLLPGCHYKWYSATEICMILDRFDGVVFIGDKTISDVYAAFNILLRQDLALGGMQQWKMSDKERDSCRCSKQYTNPECSKYFVTSNEEVGSSDPESNYRAPYACNRTFRTPSLFSSTSLRRRWAQRK